MARDSRYGDMSRPRTLGLIAYASIIPVTLVKAAPQCEWSFEKINISTCGFTETHIRKFDQALDIERSQEKLKPPLAGKARRGCKVKS